CSAKNLGHRADSIRDLSGNRPLASRRRAIIEKPGRNAKKSPSVTAVRNSPAIGANSPGESPNSRLRRLDRCRSSAGFVRLSCMPPTEPVDPAEKVLLDVVHKVGLYPVEAYVFVQQGLSYTVQKVHGAIDQEKEKEPDVSYHVSGRDLCQG